MTIKERFEMMKKNGMEVKRPIELFGEHHEQCASCEEKWGYQGRNNGNNRGCKVF